MCNIISTENAFRVVVLFFLSFFTFFAFVLFPNSGYFHPDPAQVEFYISQYPNIKWFVIIWGKWSYILFYIMGELWAMIVFSLLFWQLANKITRTEEATRFYSFFSLFGQTNLLISGSVAAYFSSNHHLLMFLFPKDLSQKELLIKSLMTVVVITGLILLSIHYWIEKVVMSNQKFFDQKKKTILKLGVRESLKLTLSSKYLGLICVLMIGYGLCMNLIEGVWMSKVRDQYITLEKFITYQSTVLFWTGIFTLFCSIVGSSIIRNFGWFWGAIITPVMIMFAGTIFFIFVGLEHKLEALLSGITYLSPLAIITFIGGLQNALGKGAKYSLFDATKEMAYIPLSDEMKTKGKAAVDIIGNKIGKSFGSMIQVILFTVFPSAQYGDISMFLGLVFIITCIIWIYAVRSLSLEYNNLIKEKSTS
jgi:ATP/ADP translocase